MKNCVVCNDAGKYKCPICLVYYCSASCCNKHRETKCKVSVKGKEVISSKQDVNTRVTYPTEDTVSVEKLKLLVCDKNLKLLLENPHLRNLLQIIDSSDKPDEIMQKAMQEPLFIEFADSCLRVVESRDEDDVR